MEDLKCYGINQRKGPSVTFNFVSILNQQH